MAKPQHQPSDEGRKTVEALASFGISEDDISRVVGIAPKTLRRHYREELDTGHVKATARVAQNLFRLACGDGKEAVVAAIFWMKTRAGWKERNEVEVKVTRDISDQPLTEEEWAARHAAGR